jgi:lipopolysaccharide transport system ATP-binding protein
MSNVAIQVEQISKRYKIGVLRHDTLRDRLAHGFTTLLNRNGNEDVPPSELWALQDVSFEVKHGEIVGIIGRNGAGKSTLLKIISQITEPTQGRIEIYGRVGSLLEVGTGFHPELSGRENIYLNGAILGMTRQEINRKFDEIVAFAEVEKFLETPVKRYSSGMYVRLAFAVAAHLEPEILVVDEVLAVGDVAFQRKCLGKMGEVANEGRTVLFVSHNMAAVQTLCARGILLRHGTVWVDADINDTVSAYLTSLEKVATQNISERTERRGKGNIRLTDVDISTGGDAPSNTLATGHPARFIFYVSKSQLGISCQFTFYDHRGHMIATFDSARQSPEDSHDPNIGAKFICEFDELLLLPGRYRINVAINHNKELEDHVEAVALFNVEQGHLHGRPTADNNRYGSVFMPHCWTLPE